MRSDENGSTRRDERGAMPGGGIAVRSGGVAHGYQHPTIHEEAARVIRTHSSHPADIRDVALGGLNLGSVSLALDLGCGFGFMSEALAGRSAPNATIVGIDAEDANRRLFLSRVRATGRQAEFVHLIVEDLLPYSDNLFGAIVSTYSLYFFPAVIPDLARVLAPDGVLVAITHTEESCRELARLVNLSEKESPLMALVSRFSGENGAGLLGVVFEEVEQIDFANELRFKGGELEPLFAYLRFKLPFMIEPGKQGGGMGGAGGIRDSVEAHLAEMRLKLARISRIRVSKDDVIFRCRGPKCR